MLSLGLPLDILWTMDDETQVTVHLADGVPELLILVPDPFGGSQLGTIPAKRPTVNCGMVGDTGNGTGRFLFRAGQGPISRVGTCTRPTRSGVPTSQ
jgi:hypothetical protein